MGWKTILKLDKSFFADLYNKGQTWGSLDTVKLTYGGVDYYGSGLLRNTQTTIVQSPKIAVQRSFLVPKLRVTAKIFCVASANTNAVLRLYYIAYKDGETIKDPQGNDAHGVEISLQNPTSDIGAAFYNIVFEQEGNTLKIFSDNLQVGSYQLSDYPASITLGFMIASISSSATTYQETPKRE